jgi:NAD(P)-dependent dehydrogenase (short-subunit alcohol dehydrogenase family)
VTRAVNEFGRLDIMVNNAGVITQMPVVEMTLSEWNRIFQINVTGTFLGCREAAKQMILQGSGGRIINGSSIAGRKGLPFLSAYGASKFAIIGMTQSLAAELAQHQITVNAYVPGNFTTTPMWDVIAAEYAQATGLSLEEVRAHFIADVPLARDGRPEEVASAVAYLASDEASFITGESMVIDGGVLRF